MPPRLSSLPLAERLVHVTEGLLPREGLEGITLRRIARGAGVDPQDVSGLVKMFLQMRDVMKLMSGQGMMGRMRMMQQLAGMGAMQGGPMPKMKKGTTKYNPRKDDRKKKRKRR